MTTLMNILQVLLTWVSENPFVAIGIGSLLLGIIVGVLTEDTAKASPPSAPPPSPAPAPAASPSIAAAPIPPPTRPAAAPGPIKSLYRTRSGRHLFSFSLHWQPEGFRIYVVSGVNYAAYGRSDSCHVTHRLHDIAGDYLCIAGAQPGNMAEVERLVRLWCEATERYCLTGQTF